AIANKVFRTGKQAQGITEIVALVSAHGRFAECSRKLRIFAKAFVGSTPTFVTRDGDARRERPVDPSCPCFDCSNACGTFDELWIACATETDIVRKERCTENVAVPVNSVDAVENRDA